MLSRRNGHMCEGIERMSFKDVDSSHLNGEKKYIGYQELSVVTHPAT
jgi:hypothetical protein